MLAGIAAGVGGAVGHGHGQREEGLEAHRGAVEHAVRDGGLLGTGGREHCEEAVELGDGVGPARGGQPHVVVVHVGHRAVEVALLAVDVLVAPDRALERGDAVGVGRAVAGAQQDLVDVERVDAEAVVPLAAVADGRELVIEGAVADDAGEQAPLGILQVLPGVAVLACGPRELAGAGDAGQGREVFGVVAELEDAVGVVIEGVGSAARDDLVGHRRAGRGQGLEVDHRCIPS